MDGRRTAVRAGHAANEPFCDLSGGSEPVLPLALLRWRCLGAGCGCRPRRSLLQRTTPRTLPGDIRGSARTAVVSFCFHVHHPRRRTWRALGWAGRQLRRRRGRFCGVSGLEPGVSGTLQQLDVIEGDSILALRVAHSAQPEFYERLARAPLLDSGSVAEAWGREVDSASCAGR